MLQYPDSDWCTFNEQWQNLLPSTLGIQFHVSSIYLADVFLMEQKMDFIADADN